MSEHAMTRCPSYEGYSVCGQDVFSHWQSVPINTGGGRSVLDYDYSFRLKPFLTNGYLSVTAKKNGRRRTITLHILITDAYLGPRPAGLETRHLDGDKMNNDIGNLSYGTHQENVQDSIKHGTFHQGEKHTDAKLTAEEVREIRTRYRRGGISQRKLAKQYGVVQQVICKVINRQIWKHVT